jgi:hypothetical protein
MTDSVSSKNESTLSQHKRLGKELTPPFLTIGNLRYCSWIDERLPEMLWAVLVVGNLDREEALPFFRYLGGYVEHHPECADVTLSGIASLTQEQRRGFIAAATSYSEKVTAVLRPLLRFPDLPGKAEWVAALGIGEDSEDCEKLTNGVAKTIWHQSEGATDCRWIRFLCQILGGKVKFSQSIPSVEESLRGVLEYPNYGDLRHIRPFIRAGEMARPGDESQSSAWPKHFWDYCFQHTACIPEEAVNERLKNRQRKLGEELEVGRKHFYKETAVVRNKVIDHFVQTSQTSAIDSRHEGSFGLALYGLTLFIELLFYRAPLSIIGRLGMRALAEVYITFKYLLKKEKTEPAIWDTYRDYGTGQLKLIYLKLKELNAELSSIEIEELNDLANEDRWVEFTPINLGHWDAENLRKMSEEVGLKDLYDKYYGYTSGFMHGAWGAVREAIYQKCVNPLHRFHRLPEFNLPLMPSVTEDARQIANEILECLCEAYPGFDARLTQPPQEVGPET